MTGAKIIRVFSLAHDGSGNAGSHCGRADDPRTAADRAINGLRTNRPAMRARARKPRVLAAFDHPALSNLGPSQRIDFQLPFPDGYSKVPASRIVHVHAKDCVVSAHR
jgi:hypothetical protein